MNIIIMRTFIALRKFMLTQKDVMEKIKILELRYDKQFKDIYQALNFLIQEKQKEDVQLKRARTGFKVDEES